MFRLIAILMLIAPRCVADSLPELHFRVIKVYGSFSTYSSPQEDVLWHIDLGTLIDKDRSVRGYDMIRWPKE